MPAPQFHLTFAELVKEHPGVRPSLRHACASEPVYTRLGAIFHDLPYYGNMAFEALRYGLRAPALDEPWAYRMHSVRPGRFVASFIQAAARSTQLSTHEKLALVGGLLSHCALDLTLHPLVNYCARRDTHLYGGHESSHHRLTEKYHALFFHLEQMSDDPIGTAAFRAKTQVVKEGSFVRGRVEKPLLDFMAEAYRGAYGDAPDRAVWATWVRHFRHFGLLVSLPIAARNSQKKRHDPTLRWRYFENDVFRFWDFYAHSERRVAELCNLGYDYFSAGDFGPAAENAFVTAAGIDDLAEPDPVGLPPLPRLSVRCTPGITSPAGHPPWRPSERRRLHRRQRRSARAVTASERSRAS
jgi:hypothetical protein